jgi:hypothetical protein
VAKSRDPQMTNSNDTTGKASWDRPTVRLVGRLDQIVQAGTGKVTVEVGDPGEPKKVENKG